MFKGLPAGLELGYPSPENLVVCLVSNLHSAMSIWYEINTRYKPLLRPWRVACDQGATALRSLSYALTSLPFLVSSPVCALEDA